ncbi:MAG: c-type cytochrome [Planctomycetaceae bacterium]|nr:c-type cytochrome [Planctomycetaceae bacterium]
MPATDDYLRQPKKMHRWFLGSAVAMFVAFLWMTAADHSREWKQYQSKFFDIQIQTLEKEREDYNQSDATQLISQLEQDLEAAKSTVDTNNSEIDALKEEVETAEAKFNLMGTQVKSTRAQRDVARANYDLGVRDAIPEDQLAELRTIFDDWQARVDREELTLEELKSKVDSLSAELKVATATRDKAAERLAQVAKDKEQQEKRLDELNPKADGVIGFVNVVKREIMEWPIIDGFNSHLRIQQDWLPDLEEHLGMTSSARFDRCRTCHLGIDKVAAGNVPLYPHGGDIEELGDNYKQWVEEGKFPHPYSTHPNPDLYLTSTSPHPTKDFGCTICHQGQGSGTSFQNASHGPNSPVQEHEWKEEYGWFDNHFWEYPMMPKRFQESQCIKCHHNVVELGVHPEFGASAPKVYEGYQLVRTYGCFGCHEIQGYKGTDPIGPDLRLEPQTPEEAERIANDPNQIAGKMRKVGPSLRHLASKVDRGWIEHWTENPKNFRPSTRMPRFFHLTNQQDEEAVKYQPVEIAAIAQFLLKNSEEFDYLEPKDGYEPDPERGKLLFSQKGCLACHSHEDFPEATASFGPVLNRVHEKLPAGADGFKWLYTWVKEPTKYHTRTKMPDLYLDPYKEGETEIDPAADIAAYLLQGGSQEWSTIDVNEEALNEMVQLFLRDVLTKDQFDRFMESRDLSLGGELLEANLKGDEVELWLGSDVGEVSDEKWKEIRLNYIGRRTVTRYGCYGCHDMSGFESARPIGVALQDWGRKDRTKLAPEHIEEYLHLHEFNFLAVPLQESEDAEEILADIESPKEFEEWAEARVADESISRKPFEEMVRETERSQILGDVAHVLEELEPNEWTEEPYEHDGVKYVLLLLENESMHHKVEGYVKRGEAGSFTSEEDRENAMSVSYLVENLLHHGRAGFAWQKIRQPRSYDFEKVETKDYDERLRMPKFPFDQQQIEAITTFVLGLVAEPPVEKYLYRPDGPAGDRIAGEYLLQQYNCTGCHVLEMPQYEYLAEIDSFPSAAAGEPADNAEAMSLLNSIAPPRKVSVPGHLTSFPYQVSGFMSNVLDLEEGEAPEHWEAFVKAPGESVAEKVANSGYDWETDPTEDWEFFLTLWEHLIVEREKLMSPIYPPRSESESQVVAVLAEDQSVNAAFTIHEETGDLVVKIVEEDLESALQPESVTLDLDLVSGAAEFTLVAEGETFLLKKDQFPDSFKSLRDLYGTVTVKFPDVKITPSSKVSFTGGGLKGYEEARGGDFTFWLVDQLVENDKRVGGSRDDAWNYVAPPLIREGAKVQTPWLFRFLQNPEMLRHMTVLRMPKFNMSPDEAQTLANYFAAVDETPYPYQEVPQKDAPYQRAMNEIFHEKYEEARTDDYLSESWQMFMFKGNKCIGCHSVGGREYFSAAKPGEPEVRGPNLPRAEDRLQPDWTLMWIYYPKWATPYTKMPVNYPLDKPSSLPLFGADPQAQTKAVRDALMNHAKLLEKEGVKIWDLPMNTEEQSND